MNTSTRIYDPALPTWPALYYDRETGTAEIRDRVVSWRSVVNSKWSIGLILCSLYYGTGLYLLLNLHDAEGLEPGAGVVLALFMTVSMAYVYYKIMKHFVAPWLIETLHAKRVRIRFTPDAIEFDRQSVPREHGGIPLDIGFQVTEDPEAKRRSYADDLPEGLKHAYAESRSVQVVVAGSRLESSFWTGTTLGVGRAVRIAEMIGTEEAEAFSSVCTAARDLTSPEREEIPSTFG
ncbi:MAG: hypothetical protein AAGJ97_04100, partial [Planctomycetota bacterium]